MAPQTSEEAVLAVLDACDAYLDGVAELRAILKRAFFALAQAKYAMGADKVTPLRIDTTAGTSCRVSVSMEGGGIEFRMKTNEAGELRSTDAADSLAEREPKACASRHEQRGGAETRSSSSDDSDQTDVDLGGSKPEPEEFSGVIGELAQKFGCLETDEAPGARPAAAPKAARSPLTSIGGGLVSPHLRVSQAEFRAALAQAVGLLNSRNRLSDALQRAGA